MKISKTLILVLLLASCSTGFDAFQPAEGYTYIYNEILIVNNSSQLLLDVTIEAETTHRIFSCGNVAPRGLCSDKFPSRPYMKSPIQISWTIGNTARQASEIVFDVPATFSVDIPIRGVLEIRQNGAISAYFEQDAIQ